MRVLHFLHDTPDLSGAIYSQVDLDWARWYLVELFEDVAPGWIDRPVGPLAVRWQNGGPSPVCELILTARTLALVESGGPVVVWSHGWNPDPADDERVLDSIRNTVDQKLGDWRRALQRYEASRTETPRASVPRSPYVLAVKSGHPAVSTDMLMDLVEHRLWSNPRYNGITALGVYRPRRDFTRSSPDGQLQVSENPNAIQPIPDSLRRMIQGEQFHVRNGTWFHSREALKESGFE
jgi:hypothetical protein